MDHYLVPIIMAAFLSRRQLAEQVDYIMGFPRQAAWASIRVACQRGDSPLFVTYPLFRSRNCVDAKPAIGFVCLDVYCPVRRVAGAAGRSRNAFVRRSVRAAGAGSLARRRAA